MERPSVSVVVDVHEPAVVVEELRRLGIDVTKSRLPIGDYTTAHVAVERKAVRDLHLTLINGRLWGQLGRLRATGKQPFLLVEGRSLDAGPVSPPAIRGALLAASENGIVVIRSETGVDSALWIHRLAKRADRTSRRADRPLYAQRPKSVGPRAASEAALGAIPGISTVSARALLNRFGSLAAVLNGTDLELSAVHGIGPTRARAIRDAATHLHCAYRSRRSRE